MKRTIISTVAIAVAMLTLSSVMNAQTPGGAGAPKRPNIHAKQRIHQGMRSGELTKGEVKQLRDERQDLKQDVKAAKADGTVTPEERSALKEEAKNYSKDIYTLKHNEVKRQRRSSGTTGNAAGSQTSGAAGTAR